jgi:hypothetical protein
MKKQKNNQWMRYTALGTQILAFLALGVFGGLKLDEWLHATPLFITTLPALALIGVFVQLYKELVK